MANKRVIILASGLFIVSVVILVLLVRLPKGEERELEDEIELSNFVNSASWQYDGISDVPSDENDPRSLPDTRSNPGVNLEFVHFTCWHLEFCFILVEMRAYSLCFQSKPGCPLKGIPSVEEVFLSRALETEICLHVPFRRVGETDLDR